MHTRTALKIAIESIQREARRLYTFDANLYRKGMVKSIITERHHKKMKRMEDAVAILEEIRADGSISIPH